MDSHAGWLWQMMDPVKFDALCKKTVRRLRGLRRGHKFDSIAFCGLSGSLLAAAVAREMKLKMIAVRKPGEATHSLRRCELSNECTRAIVLDDFIEAGTTFRRIVRACQRNRVEVVGALLHEPHGRGVMSREYAVAGRKYPLYWIGK